MDNRRGVVRGGFLAILGASAIVAGCAAASSPEATVTESPSSSDLPAGAIPVGNDIYMVPVVKDETGCMQYRMHAPGRGVAQVIYYADGKGGFTTNREAADCPPLQRPMKPPR
jgi:hypothetical protein